MSRTHIPGKTVDVRYYNTTLHLYLDMGVGIGGDKWPAAEKFCHLLAYNGKHAFFGELFNSKTCLELGSGNGIVGILLDKLYQPKQVVITDLESHVEHIRKNLVLNSAETHCSAEALDWKCFSLPFQQFDFIFALECVYRADLYVPLIKTIAAHGHDRTVTFLGLTRDFATPAFFRLLLQYGFHYRKVPDATFAEIVTEMKMNDANVASPPEFGDNNIAMFMLHRSSCGIVDTILRT